jgi:hypothetical protein
MKNLKVGPRTIFTDHGEPVLVSLAMRPATTAPGRVKAILCVPTLDEDGTEGIAPLPFAQPIMAPDGKQPTGFTPEFRLEMN